MTLDKADTNKYYKRKHWDNLAIKFAGYRWIYLEEGEFTGTVPSLSIQDCEDFVCCDEYGKELNYKEEDIMAKVDKDYIGGEYKLVGVTYNLEGASLAEYIFKIDIDLDVKVDDIVVVDSKNGLSLCKVLNISDNSIENADIVKQAKAWVVDVVSMDRHNKKIDATEKRAYILQQLDEKKKAMEALNMYALLAEIDPEAKKLVDELKTLGA
jgi:hypothetical protein